MATSSRGPPVLLAPERSASPPNGTSAAFGVSTRAAPLFTSAPVDGLRVADFSIGFSTGFGTGLGFTSGAGSAISGVFAAGGAGIGLASAVSSCTGRLVMAVMPPVSAVPDGPSEIIIGVACSSGCDPQPVAREQHERSHQHAVDHERDDDHPIEAVGLAAASDENAADGFLHRSAL